jgi:hypothetical protein
MLTWQDHCWHCDGHPIHAGSEMEMLCPDGVWIPVSVESRDAGLTLFAYFGCHDMLLRVLAHSDSGPQRELRWPQKKNAGTSPRIRP